MASGNSTKPVIKLSQTKLDINDPDLSVVFDDIQGNILKSHGRSHSRHLFIQLSDDVAKNKAWLSKIGNQLTSASEQNKTAVDYKTNGKEHLFTGCMLSYHGYKALGLEDQKIPDDKAFRQGMKNIEFRYDTGPDGPHARTINPLNDNPENWETAFQKDIDVLLILAYGGATTKSFKAEEIIKKEAAKIQNDLAGIGEVLSIEEGYVLKNENNTVIEHFGFADGVSNPLFLKSDIDKLEKTEGLDKYDSSAPFGLIAVNDIGGKNLDTSFGSYFVYRKMQQNLKAFKEQTNQFSTLLSEASDSFIEPEFAGALAFGRFKDGTPISLKTDDENQPLFNNFNFEGDDEGLKCPFQSHIRKTNPRGDTNRKANVPMASERSHRIARRGISYGSKNLNPTQEWTDCGLLFLSAQSDIEQQFILMQSAWSDNVNFLEKNTGTDPITGGQNKGEEKAAKSWNLEINNKKVAVEFSYKDLVRVRGGEYFFAPSISFCKHINQS